MATTATQVPYPSPPLITSMKPSNKNIIPDNNNPCVKVLVESCNLKSIPSQFAFTNDPTGSTSDALPTVDFSLLISADPDQRSRAIQDLGKACLEWGFFVLINHGIPESVMKGIIDASLEYFELPEEEKRRYEPKTPSDPIKSGSASLMDTTDRWVHLWRDYVKSYVHPQFYCPHKPQSLRDILFELSERTRPVARKLIQGIAENLGLEDGYVDEALGLDSSFQVFAANLYPPCPQPDQAIGIPPHTDPGLFTFLIHNGVVGLQIEHDGQWFNADSQGNSILVIAGNHLEIFSNGRCKSLNHRAVVNSERERISVVVSNGPSAETVVSPAAPLVLKDGRALYKPMKYIEYMEWLQTKCRIQGEHIFEQLMVRED